MAKKRPDGDGDVCERCLWRIQRAIRSGSNTAMASKQRLVQTEPMLQQEEPTNE